MNAIVKTNKSQIEARDLRQWAVNEFIKSLYLDERINQTTERTYRNIFKQMFRFFEMNETSKPDLDTMQLWKEYLTNAGRAIATINLYIIASKSFFRYLNDRGIYLNNCHQVKPLRTGENEATKQHKRGFIRFEWFQDMLTQLDTSTLQGKRNKAILLVKAFCGLRDVELIRLTHSDFKLIGDRYKLEVQGKGRKTKEFVGCDPIAVEAIILYQRELKRIVDYKENDPLFVSVSNNSLNKRLSSTSIRNSIKDLLDALPISPDTRKQLSAHSLRHSFVTWQLLAGENIRTVQKRARHKSSRTTEIYAHDLEGEAIWDDLQDVFKPLTEILKDGTKQTGTPAADHPTAPQINPGRLGNDYRYYPEYDRTSRGGLYASA